jgi:hypothetical protein
VWRQCSPLMQHKLQATKNFDNIKQRSEVVDLLKEIKQISHTFDGQSSIYDSIDEAMRKYYLYRQGPHDSNDLHLKIYKSLVDTISHFGGSVLQEEVLYKYKKEIDKNRFEMDEAYKKQAREKC